MATCNGCGGTVGRDCFNPQECEWISRDIEARHYAQQYAEHQEYEAVASLENDLARCQEEIERLQSELDGALADRDRWEEAFNKVMAL